MSRKIMIYAISALIIAIAVTQVWSFFLPVFDSTQLKIFDLPQLVMGILFFLAGWNLFRLKEGGRAFTFWLLFVALVWNLLLLGLILPFDSNFGVSMKFFGKPILNSKDNYTSTIISLSALFAINLSIVVFLSQRETKKIFLSEAVDNVGSTRNEQIKL